MMVVMLLYISKKEKRRRRRKEGKEEREGRKKKREKGKRQDIYMNLQVGKKNFTRVKVCEKKKLVVNYTRLKQMQGFFSFFKPTKSRCRQHPTELNNPLFMGK